MRVCQPSPAARKACSTSGDKRMVVDTLGGEGSHGEHVCGLMSLVLQQLWLLRRDFQVSY